MRKEDSLKLRFNLFKKIARKTWQRVATAHSFGLNLDERGITADIIVEILSFCKKHKMPIGLFAGRGKDESTYGSDMDIFVEIEHDKYIWFAIQAKSLKKDNKYDNLGYERQWEKLEDLESKSGCKSYYLLYNGKRNYFRKGLKDICGNLFKTAHFGCSLVEPNFVKEQVALGRKKFEDFHDNPAQPWHVLASCPMSLFKSQPKYYSLRTITQAAKNANYDQIFKTGIELNYANIETTNDNRITDGLKTAERTSSDILVIPLNNT